MVWELIFFFFKDEYYYLIILFVCFNFINSLNISFFDSIESRKVPHVV